MSRQAIILLSLMSVLVVFASGLVWWLGRENKSAGEELSSVIQTLNEKDVTARDQRTLVNLLKSTEEERGKISSRIIEGDTGAIQFLSRIDNLALSQNIKLETQNLTIVPNARSPYSGLAITYSFSGSEQAVRSFLKALEIVPYSSSLESVTISKATDNRTGVVLAEGKVKLVIAMLEI